MGSSPTRRAKALSGAGEWSPSNPAVSIHFNPIAQMEKGEDGHRVPALRIRCTLSGLKKDLRRPDMVSIRRTGDEVLAARDHGAVRDGGDFRIRPLERAVGTDEHGGDEQHNNGPEHNAGPLQDRTDHRTFPFIFG